MNIKIKQEQQYHIECLDFLTNPDETRNLALSSTFKDVLSPYDSVIYPDICLDIPKELSEEINQKLHTCLNLSAGKTIKFNSIFMRLSTAKTFAPNQAHTDKSMGQYTLVLYLNAPKDCKGGTEFLSHINHGSVCPITSEALQDCADHSNDQSKWLIDHICNMEYNKAVIFPAELFHRAAPIGGFGETLEDGRLVLTAFFDVVDNISVENYSEAKHYSMLTDWWKAYNYPVLPASFLPEGLVVSINGAPVVAGFMFHCPASNIAWFEFQIADKNASKEDRSTALNNLYINMEALCKSRGVTIIMSSFNHKGLISKAQENGFQVTDLNMTHLIKVLKGNK